MNNTFLDEINNLNNIKSRYNFIFNNDDFLEYDDVYKITNRLLPNKIRFRLKYLFNITSYYKYYKKYIELSNLISNINNAIENHNEKVFSNKKNYFFDICGQIENKKLDDQQINSIVRKNKNQLVIAGAGSGKTTTIIGKVKYLLLTKQYKPQDILLLSFTNSSASEMKERLKKETGIELDVMTFHKLGLEIIKKGHNENYKIFNKDLYQVVKETINDYICNQEYLKKLIYFVSTARFNIKEDFNFKNEEEYNDFLKTNKLTTLKGEIVKSYGELEIANYLFSNNILYCYEEEYKYETINDKYQQYNPDFYLPEYDIYIEYFGIDENDEVAPYLKSKNGLSASETYNESIKWKRNLHQENNTIMIETFYYENKQKKLISNLESKLKKYNVKINPKSNEEIWNIIENNNSGLINEICNLFVTIINLIKSNNYTFDYLEEKQEVQKVEINKLTTDLIKPIYTHYQELLNKNNMIDFNDMINIAINTIDNNQYLHNYKYVIVDEYQDMSNSRYRLLNSMRKQKEYNLFCVGDDWQSIYRFSGSDIDLITNFEKYWGYTYISYIERTYRFTSMLSILSGNFVMKNPKQYKKQINAKTSNDFALKFINGYTENKCIDFLEEHLKKLDKNSIIYFLGRYSFDINILKKNCNFSMYYNPHENITEIIYNKRRDLKIKFMTIHKSKGLQADYVVILNNKNYGMGFPSKINDLPLIKLLLASGLDDYPFSEERRLFYVALTRSKKQTILLTIENNKSIFIYELEKDYDYLIKTDTNIKSNIYKCPKCGKRLVQKSGKYGIFIGCSNYPNCKYTKNY